MAVSNQGGLFDVEIEDAEFEEAIEAWLEDKSNRTESASITAKRKAKFEEHVSRMKEGNRVRVGAYCFVVSLNERDSYEVESSSAKGMRGISRVADAE